MNGFCFCLQDCPGKADFDEKRCECVCRNEDEKEKCDSKSTGKETLHYWDPDKCSCNCINRDLNCGSTFEFDTETCRCEKLKILNDNF